MDIRIGKKTVGENFPVYVVAEAGINHNGSLKIAKKMIIEAKNAEADAIKFQTFKADDLATPDSPYYKTFKNVELSNDDFKELSDFAKNNNITFFSTPFSEESADALEKLNVPMYKISSGDLTYNSLLKNVARKKKPIIISTGMSDLTEIKNAVNIIKSQKNNKIIILHSISGYPTPKNEANISAISFLKEKFQYPIGFSDNGSENLVPLVSVATGACMIEKHFTLNKKMKGPDQSMSANPKEFKNLVKQIREIEVILGNKEKKIQPSEKKIKKIARRSIIANCNINKNTKILSKMIMIKRPSTGIPPADIDKVIGKIANKKIKEFEPIKWKYLSD